MEVSNNITDKIKKFVDMCICESRTIVGSVIGVIYGRRNIAEAVRRATNCEGMYDVHPTEYFVLYVYAGGSCAMWSAGESSFNESISPEVVEAIKNNDSRVMDMTHFSNPLLKSIDIFKRSNESIDIFRRNTS